MSPPSDKLRILIAIPTYKERDNLAPLIKGIHAHVPEAEILVIDDNSPDGTGALAEELAQADSRIHVKHRTGKLGLGTAILAGMRYSLEHGYDYHITMDADHSHDPRYLPGILAGMSRHDVMIGSRYIAGGGTRDWPLSRRIMSGAVNLLCRFLMRLPARDTSGGYRCYHVALLRRTDLDHLLSHGYSFQEEVLFRCRQAGARIGESPIIFEDRRAGTSKVDPREAVRSMSLLIYLGVQAFFGFDRNST